MANGKRVSNDIQVSEKYVATYRFEVKNRGGHSSLPVPDNAIYRLSEALIRLSRYKFPSQTNEVTRAYLEQMAKVSGPALAAQMRAASQGSAGAIEQLANSATTLNAMLRTTCVATMLDGGHATNALPQRARANINCRIFPGTSAQAVRDKLESLVADPEVKVSLLGSRSEVTKSPPPLTPEIMGPIEQMAGQLWPGVPIIPVLTAGATDGAFLSPVGIPTYGVTGLFGDPDGNGVHGLNERIRVASLYNGRDFLYGIVKLYAMQK
jgi:acetylornithine deacetylase/succinyl-diaminopimelate desuccinylase-like protein